MEKDFNGQPKTQFRRSQNTEKALIELLGLCEGLTADNTINADELACLDGWIKEHIDLLGGDGDFNDLKHQLSDILRDGIVTEDELEDTCELIDCIISNRSGSYCYDSNSAVQHLIAMLHGILADAKLNEKEVRHLATWLRRTSDLRHIWPADILANRVEAILEDGVITSEELIHLQQTLVMVAGGTFQELGTVSGITTTAYQLEDTGEAVEITGKHFVVTGAFLYGTRKICEAAIESRGGIICAAITKKVDYLVVGIQASRDWINSSHGLKMQKAAELRRAGHKIRTVHESLWAQAL
ncbi:MAG: BRCT domain-containing protein [Pseudomonadota bacterium]